MPERHHPGFADHRHVTGILGPAGHDMHVLMTGHACPGPFPHVHADVERFRVQHVLDDLDRQLHRLDHLVRLRRRQAINLSDVTVRHHHNMAGIVRELVHDNKGFVAAIQDQILLVIAAFQRIAKNTPFFLRSEDIFRPPGSP